MRAALAFLTPFGGSRIPSARAVQWFPLVGALVGLGVGGAWRGAEELWPPAVAAALAVLTDLVLTGMLHLDGLIDSADGLLPHLTRDRRLAVMSEPTAGAFGIVVVVATLLARWAALASMRADVLLVAGLWCISRTAMAALMTALPYARDEGLASAFAAGPRGASRQLVVVSGALLGSVLVGMAAGWPAVAILLASSLAVVGVGALARVRIGGFTGDVLGAAGVIAETVGLVVAAAKW
jgi:adenosylcobinamide-GDP ribazoletransferase